MPERPNNVDLRTIEEDFAVDIVRRLQWQAYRHLANAIKASEQGDLQSANQSITKANTIINEQSQHNAL